MSRGGPPYRERDYYGSRYGSEYGSSSRSYWSSGQPSDRSEGEDARLARYERDREWARYDRERYERERYERDRAYEDRRDPYENRRSDLNRWDERERADPRRWPEGREYRDPRDADRWASAASESRYDRSSYYDRGYRDLDAADRNASSVDLRAERDLPYQRQSATWRRSPSPSHRSKSPRSVSRRSTPSSRRNTPPPLSATAAAERTSSSATFASAARRDSATAIPSGPREYVDRDRERERLRDRDTDRDSMQQPPTGPRNSFVRPPPVGPSGGSSRAPPSGPRASYDEQSYFSRTPGRGSYEDSQYNRSLSRNYDRSPYGNAPSGNDTNTTSVRVPPVTTPTGPRRENNQRDNASHLQVPTRSPAHGYSSSSVGVGSGPTTPAAVNGTPEKVQSRKASYAEGLRVRGKSINLQLEQKIYDLSVDRISFTRKLYSNPAMESLRKALHELADSDIELAGARLKSNLTESALEKAKEEAEAWSIESARIELEQRNSGLQGYWNVV